MQNPSQGNPNAAVASGVLTSIRHIDHVTYVTSFDDEKRFCETWQHLGFHETVRLRTVRYPANHIALISGQADGFPWLTMTGLSTSEDAASPINEFVRRYGAGIQHVAYNVDPRKDAHEVYDMLKKDGWDFMTPVLSYNDENEGKLNQFFAKPTAAYGTFVEFAQRLEGKTGEVFGGFNTDIIDDLYDHYRDISLHLDKQK
jgi:4-hydroxyphenylpyruvate dioxygenase-like putative hemolysin